MRAALNASNKADSSAFCFVSICTLGSPKLSHIPHIVPAPTYISAPFNLASSIALFAVISSQTSYISIFALHNSSITSMEFKTSL